MSYTAMLWGKQTVTRAKIWKLHYVVWEYARNISRACA